LTPDVLVVVGTGGMGQAVARRLGSGRHLLLADLDEAALEGFAEVLRREGHQVTTHPVDVTEPASMTALADRAGSLGQVSRVVHTAGLSPTQASVEALLRVDLVGVALFLQEFGRVVAAGGAGVVIASMAGHLAPALTKEQKDALRGTAPSDLLALPLFDGVTDPGLAYSVAKAANRVQVQAAAGAWGERGARINSISPGVISTPMGQQELAGESGESMRVLIAMSATKRLGTADDIAAAADFLLGPHASFVTGTDLLVDGGAVAGVAPLLG